MSYSSVSSSLCHSVYFASLGIRRVVARFISLASASGESSLIARLLLSPRKPLRWVFVGTPNRRLAPLVKCRPFRTAHRLAPMCLFLSCGFLLSPRQTLRWFAAGTPAYISVSSSLCHSVHFASLGIRQSPRGLSATEPTFGPSGRQFRLNCWEKNRR